MDPQLLEQALKDYKSKGQKVAAIIVVHLYGMPAKMNEIISIAHAYGVPIIEDAAEALGSHYYNKPCGSMGAFGVLSFNGNKIITTSGGGALVSHDANAIKHARFLSTQAKEPFPFYQHQVIGYNYRMSNICAGIGRGQMLVLDQRVEARRSVHEYYKKALAGIPSIRFLQEPEGSYSNRWLTTIYIDPLLSNGITNEHIRLKLETYNVESRKLWKPMHLQPVFDNCQSYINGTAEDLFEHGLCLPSSSFLTEDTLQFVAQLIIAIFNERES
jgi:dTDP-4-amino-4,6-dideoxygalactose transaminase